jgi:hypothetical protein
VTYLGTILLGLLSDAQDLELGQASLFLIGGVEVLYHFLLCRIECVLLLALARGAKSENCYNRQFQQTSFHFDDHLP